MKTGNMTTARKKKTSSKQKAINLLLDVADYQKLERIADASERSMVGQVRTFIREAPEKATK